MKRLFLSNILLLVLLNLVVKPFYLLGIDRGVQNEVGPVEYGLYFSIFNFTYLFQMVSDFGLINFNNTQIAKHMHLLSKYFPRILATKGLLSLFYLLVVMGAAVLFDYPAALLLFIIWVGINQIMHSGILFLRSNFNGLGYYRTDSLLSVADKFLMIILCGYLLWYSTVDFSIEWFVLSHSFSLFISFVIGFLFLLPHLHFRKVRVRLSFMLMILRKSLPYALVLLLMTLYTRIDAVMIERLLPNGRFEAGVYAAGFRLLDAANLLGILFAGLLLGMFSKMIRAGEPVNDLVKLSFSILWSISVLVSVVSFFYSDQIMRLLYENADSYWGEVFSILMLNYIAFSTAYIYGTLLTANGNLREMNILFAGGVVINITLNYLLILRYGALGAAWATVLTQFTITLGLLLIARSRTSLQLEFSLIGRSVLYVLVLVAAVFVLRHLWIDWLLQCFLITFVGIVTAWVLGLVPLRWPFQPEQYDN